MKKMKRFLICLFMVASLVFSVSSAFAGLPTIDSILAQELPADKVEVYNELDDYILLDQEFDEYDYDFKFIILQREAPEKEFSSKVQYPPFDNSNGFDENFNGVDIGKPRIWLRTDLMRQLPEEYRARSMKEATYLVVAETQYAWDGTIISSNYEKTTDDEPPEFKNLEEMYAYFSAHPKTVNSLTYYPKFGVYSVISLYENTTKRSLLYGVTYTQSRRFAQNIEAFDQWENMQKILNLLNSMETGNQAELQGLWESLESNEFVPQAKKELWKSCIDANEVPTAYYSVSEYFWSMAEDLKQLDSSETNRNNYDMIIQERDRDALALFVNYCNYSGIKRSIESIQQTGDYMANPDNAWMEQQLQEIVDIFK